MSQLAVKVNQLHKNVISMLIEFALFTDEGVWTSWGAWTPCVQTNVNSNTGSRSRTLSHTGTTPCTGGNGSLIADCCRRNIWEVNLRKVSITNVTHLLSGLAQ